LSARPSDDRHRERVAILAVDEERTLFALADENISTIQIHSVGASTPHRAHPSRALRAPPCPVRTKRAKTFTTWFFPVGDDIRQMVVDWVAYLRGEKGFGPDDPLFPKTTVAPGKDLAFRAVSLDHAPWANANPVRDIFRDACKRAGLPYFNPHLLRNTLVQVAYDRKLDAEAFKAWSQNVGHESCLTTFSSAQAPGGNHAPPRGRRRAQ
jgi:hypothetical protein